MGKIPDEAVEAAIDKWRDHEFDGTSDTPRMRAALTAALPFLPVQGAVKKLEWSKGVVDIAQPQPGMKYVACSTTPKGSWAFWLDHAPETRAVFTSEEAAKAAAQADYEARILSAIEVSGPDMGNPITLVYTNYRGETSERTITPIKPWFGSTEWHPEPQWLLRAYDHDKCAERDFALKDFGRQQPSAARELALEEAAKIAFDVSENGHYYGEASVDSTSSIYQQGAFEVYEALRALSSQPVADHIADAGKVEGDGERWRIFEAACARGYWGIELEQASNDEPILYPIKVHRDTLVRIVEAHNAALPSAPASEGAE